MYVIFIIVIGLFVLDKIINNKNSKRQDTQTDIENIGTQLSDQSYINSFYKKDYLLTSTELKFYKLLKPITNKMELNLFCQVAMYEIVNCSDRAQFNRIRSKCIDFVITDQDCKIKCCIELDDYSHNRVKRIERDELINAIFEKTNTKLLRIKVKSFYDVQELEELIKSNIQ